MDEFKRWESIHLFNVGTLLDSMNLELFEDAIGMQKIATENCQIIKSNKFNNKIQKINKQITVHINK